MSEENLVRFMNKVTDSEELQAKIGEEIDTEALIALGAECGCEFNAGDWIRMYSDRNRVVGNIRVHNADGRRTARTRKQIPAWTNHILFTAWKPRAYWYDFIDWYTIYPWLFLGIILFLFFVWIT